MPDVSGPVLHEPEERLTALGRNAAASLLVIVLVVGAALAPRLRQQLGARPSAEQCAALVDRYVEQASLAGHPRARKAQIAGQLAASAGQPGRLRQLSSCERALAPQQVECALGSPNVDELERCLQ